MKRLIPFVLIYLLVCSHSFAQTSYENSLMPMPQKVDWQDGKFRITNDLEISLSGEFDPRLYKAATSFIRQIDHRTGIFFKNGFVDSKALTKNTAFKIQIERAGQVALDMQESYNLEIKDQQILLTAPTDIGALRGLETLQQLLNSDEKGYFFPSVTIHDEPRFAWRGLMLDVSRHFMPLHVVKRQLDLMAAMKLNVFHWHLTDDQGIRFESKSYPKLHELASDGMYYTHEEMKSVVAYAAERGIRVVPEIDVPGHATAFLVAYPDLASAPIQYMHHEEEGVSESTANTDAGYQMERHTGIFDATLDPTNDKTYELLFAVFEEMAEIFPDPYFHIGGDENEGKQWDWNSDIQAFMKANGIADNHALQSYFNRNLLVKLQSLGKTMMGWDEILQPDLPKDAVIQSWRGKESLYQAAEKGYQAILSNGYYIDLMHGAAHHYLNDPLGQAGDLSEGAKTRILGGEATMWSEHIRPLTLDSRVWPRMAAIAERFWSDASVNDVGSMYQRLDQVSLWLETKGSTHLTAQEVLLRNLCKGTNTTPVKNLLDVVNPLRFYTRNPKGTYYQTSNPFSQFADAATTDAKGSRDFAALSAAYLADPTLQEKLINKLSTWEVNNQNFQELAVQSPVLKEVSVLSENLSKIAGLGKESIELGLDRSDKWYAQMLSTLEEARTQGGRTELTVVGNMERVIKHHTAHLKAQKTKSKVKVDGKLSDWKGVEWHIMMPDDRYGKDTTRFALQWDTKNLYLAYQVKNKDLQASHQQRDAYGLHEDDGVEFLIDPNYDRSIEWKEDDIAYHVNVFNEILDEKGNDDQGFNRQWNGKAKSAVRLSGKVNDGVEDNGYTVEIAISWNELGVKPSSDLKMGINLAVNDKTNDAKNTYTYYDYMQLPMFHLPAAFATLTLAE